MGLKQFKQFLKYGNTIISGATKVFEGVQVLELNSSERKLITSVDTDHGRIECGHFINAAGLVNILMKYNVLSTFIQRYRDVMGVRDECCFCVFCQLSILSQ